MTNPVDKRVARAPRAKKPIRAKKPRVRTIVQMMTQLVRANQLTTTECTESVENKRSLLNYTQI